MTEKKVTFKDFLNDEYFINMSYIEILAFLRNSGGRYRTTTWNAIPGNNNCEKAQYIYEHQRERTGKWPPVERIGDIVGWECYKCGNQFAFGCGEIILTKAQIRNYVKIQKIMNSHVAYSKREKMTAFRRGDTNLNLIMRTLGMKENTDQ